MAGTAKAADAELRALADTFRMTDINSARRDERAKPSVPMPAQSKGDALVGFGPFAAHINPERARNMNNQSGAQCLPSANQVNYKARVGTNRAHGGGQLGLPSVQSGTTYEARHVPNTRGG